MECNIKHVSITSEKVRKSRRETPYLSLRAGQGSTSAVLTGIVFAEKGNIGIQKGKGEIPS